MTRTRGLVAAALLTGLLAPSGATAGSGQLKQGEYLFPGQNITQSCYYRMNMQGDGNLVTVAGSFYHAAKLRGVPAAFGSLDFSYNTDHHLAIAKKVAHPNAAKLLAAVLVGPEGQKIAEAQIGIGNRNYEGSLDHQLEAAALGAGFPTFHWWDNKEVRDLSLSPEGIDLQREIEQIFKGG